MFEEVQIVFPIEPQQSYSQKKGQKRFSYFMNFNNKTGLPVGILATSIAKESCVMLKLWY